MRNIIIILFILLPVPFLFINYAPFEDINSQLYITKHAIVLLGMLLCIIYKSPFKKVFKYEKPLIFNFFLFISYCITNWILLSNFNFKYLSYIFSIIIIVLLSISIGKMHKGFTLFKYIYYSLSILLISSIAYSLLFDINLNSNWTVLDGNVKTRWTFGFLHPGFLGSYAMLTGILSAYLIQSKQLKKRHAIITIFSFILIILTNTRNSFVALSIFLLVSYSSVTFKLFKIGLISSLVSILIILNVNPYLLNVISSGRYQLWIKHFEYNYESFNYFFGTGLGNARRIEYLLNNGEYYDQNTIFHLDNYYFEVFLQFGVLGIIFLFLIIRSIFNMIKKMKNIRMKRDAFAILFVILFFSFFDSSFLTTGNLISVILWPLLIFQLYQSRPNFQLGKIKSGN